LPPASFVKAIVRHALACVALLLLGTAPAHAVTDFVFAVTEGVTYQATPKDIRDKFDPIAELISRALHRNVKLVLVPAYDDARAGLAKQEFDLAFVHPAHVALSEVKAGRYQTLAWTAGYTDYAVSVLVAGDSPIKSFDQLKGRVLVTPDPDSITAVMVRAMLRGEKLGSTDVKVITTRYQDAVPFYIENTFAQAGATAASAVVKQWTDKGGKVVVRSRGVPIKQLIVSTKVPVEDRERVREVLLQLGQSEPGRKALAAVGYKGFVAPQPDVEQSAIAWLGL